MTPHPISLDPRRLAALVLLALLAACATPGEPEGIESPPIMASPTRVDSDATGPALLRQGRYEAAYKLYTDRLRERPDDVEAKLGLAETYLAANRPGLALDMFTELADHADYAAVALQGQGLAHWRLGNVDTALARLSEAVGADPGLWRAWNALGAVHDVKQNWPAAGSSYEHALELRPDEALLHNNVGASLLLQERLPEAIVAFERALQIDSTLKAAENNLRLALALQGRYIEAIQGTQEAARARALNNAGYAALLRGDLATAENLLRQALQLSPTYYDRAARNLERVTAMAPES